MKLMKLGHLDYFHSLRRVAASLLVWNSPRREGMLPAGDIRGNWNVTWFPADVWPGLGMYFPRLRKRGLSVCPGLKRRELKGGGSIEGVVRRG